MTLIADTTEVMDETERELLLKYLDGHRMYAEVNGRRFEVLYASHQIGDPMPWIAVAAPEIQFPNGSVTIGEAGRCVAHIKDHQKKLWAHAYEEARTWGFAPKGAWEHANDVVAGY